MKRFLLFCTLLLSSIGTYAQQVLMPVDISRTSYRGNTFAFRLLNPSTLPEGHTLQPITARAYNNTLKNAELPSNQQPEIVTFTGGTEVVFSNLKTQLIGETGAWLEIKYGTNVVGAGTLRFTKTAGFGIASVGGGDGNTTIPITITPGQTVQLGVSEAGGAQYVALAQQAAAQTAEDREAIEQIAGQLSTIIVDNFTALLALQYGPGFGAFPVLVTTDQVINNTTYPAGQYVILTSGNIIRSLTGDEINRNSI
ncbi:hypothetical protein GCM10027347_52680 [Larkinella harenae]